MRVERDKQAARLEQLLANMPELEELRMVSQVVSKDLAEARSRGVYITERARASVRARERRILSRACVLCACSRLSVCRVSLRTVCVKHFLSLPLSLSPSLPPSLPPSRSHATRTSISHSHTPGLHTIPGASAATRAEAMSNALKNLEVARSQLSEQLQLSTAREADLQKQVACLQSESQQEWDCNSRSCCWRADSRARSRACYANAMPFPETAVYLQAFVLCVSDTRV